LPFGCNIIIVTRTTAAISLPPLQVESMTVGSLQKRGYTP
jgi:hypothetical protein